MGLFIRKQINDSRQLYTMGLRRTKLIVGLGNIGKQYDGSRHNIGFAVADAYIEAQQGSWREQKDLKCLISDVRQESTRVIVIKPTTFMNLSGESVQAVANFYKILPKDIIVLHDELDISFGNIKTKFGGGSAGHNGIKSIIEKVLGECVRIRIGIGPKLHPEQDSADFVLSKFDVDQLKEMSKLLKEAYSIINEIIFSTNALISETRSFLL